jgi:type I restriction enzyme, S subunit
MSEVHVPDGWDALKVSQVATRHFSGPSPTCDERNIASDDEWGLLKTTAITWAGWNAAAHKVPPRVYWGNETIEVRSGDVLVTKAGPRHKVGVVAYVTDTPPHLMVSGKMVGLSPNPRLVLPQVLAGALSMGSSQKYLDERTTGMAESQVNFTNDVLLKIFNGGCYGLVTAGAACAMPEA